MSLAVKLIDQLLEASAVGKVQKAILDYVRKNKHDQITDMAKDPSFRGVHFGKIETAAGELAKKGLI